MKLTPKALFQRYLKSRNLSLIDSGLYKAVFGERSAKHIAEFYKTVPADKYASAIELTQKSKAQLLQDIFVLCELGFDHKGYFVEFGAVDGVQLSNTHMLETLLGWKGIVAEPVKSWHGPLRNNRNCHVETDCVWRESGKTLQFRETSASELSTLVDFSTSDFHARSRQTGTDYPVQTISLYDMLQKYDAPRRIDFLSIDTEGSEFDILENFDFGAYEFSVITCEHNYTPQRQKIYDLLTSKGYVRKWENVSQFDDWYVRGRP